MEWTSSLISMHAEIPVNCCIVIPIYRPTLTWVERAAVLNTCKLLSGFSLRIICPDGLDLYSHMPELLAEMRQYNNDVDILQLESKFFASTHTYNQLLLSPSFYRLFLRWQYMLIAQIDAWIFSPRLAPWLAKAYSYVGAPWRTIPNLPPGIACPPEAVGNGGLSLRRVRDHYAVLSSWRFRCSPVLGIQELLVAHPPLQNFSWRKPLPSIAKAINRVRLILMRLTSWRNSLAYFCRCGLNEDLVFGLLVPRIFVGFLVPDPAMAAHFALDANPDFFYGRYFSSDCLPFGCHAWEKSYGQFWQHRNTSLPRLSVSSAD